MANAKSESWEFDPKEPIPGYTTTELIGRGGSGEVWRALAPGGLAKAVKIVYGDADQERARIELKALARIKDVRHPLLLSIERIEIAGSNLVIVTELADRSLKDYFVEKRKSNCVGVAQDELLRYLGDAADALDFLYGQFSLQHLDVKPENILLLSGRAKVGDFGLVRNLYERSNSIVGGLTPTYSPPELFDGKPTRHSDQYSLAIVYMQMLTGLLPFNGGSPAQLAGQHLQGVPDLSPLPRRQRPAIARALSKDPAQRFENCSALIDALRTSATDSAVAIPAPSDSASGDTIRGSAAETARGVPISVPAAAKNGPVKTAGNRPQPASQGEPPAGVQPLVIVGIGGAAVQVLGKLVNRLHDRLGDESTWPPIQIVLMDSDARSLVAPSGSQGHNVHLVPMRLRSAETFGARAKDILQWLNRKWFYGIPRDLTTASYRPLGRLALITHAARVREVIQTAVAAASGTEEHSARGAQSPRVIVLGSICGGTGGGALLDVAYAVRGELKRQGLVDDDVHGVLLHSTPRGNAERDKSLANAYAMLSELNHFGRPGSHFPGEPAFGAPPFHGDNAPFRRTCMLDLGRGLGGRDWDIATEKAAEFLYVSEFTAARDVCDFRQKSDAEEGTPQSLWRCDVLAFGAGTTRLVTQFARRACVDVVRLWREGADSVPAEGEGTAGPTALMTVFAAQPAAQSAKVDSAARQKLAECNLALEDFVEEAMHVVKLEAGCEATEYVRSLVEEALGLHSDTWKLATDRIDAMVSAIDQILRCNTGGDRSAVALASLFDRIVARLAVRGSGRATMLLEWIREMVDTPTVRVEGARQYAASAKLLLQDLHERLVKHAAENRRTALSLAVEARAIPVPVAESRRKRNAALDQVRDILNAYASVRLKESLYLAIAKQLRLIEAEMSTLIYQLDNLSRHLSLIKDRLQDANEPALGEQEDSQSSDELADRYYQLVLQRLGEHRSEIARDVELAIDQQVFHGRHGLRRFLEPDAELWKTLSEPLSSISRRAVLKCLKSMICELIQNAGPSGDAGGEGLIDVILTSLTAPRFSPTESSAVERILVVPAEMDQPALRARLGAAAENVGIIAGPGCDVTLCTIQKDVPIDRFANEIIGGLEVFRQLAAKLHTRIDIQWCPLVARQDRNHTIAPPLEPEAATPTSIIAVPKPNEYGPRQTVLQGTATSQL
jgi:hypothetical protein